MLDKEIDLIVDEITIIAKTHFSTFGGIKAVSMSENNFKHGWNIDYDNKFNGDYSVKIDSKNDAIEIIHRFSNEPKLQIKEFLDKYHEKSPMYLHYHKTLKHL